MAPKSKRGTRTVPIFAVLRPFLVDHGMRTKRSGEDRVFGRTSSGAFVPSTVRARAVKAWEAAGLEVITLHECRHTFASLLIDAAVNAKAICDFMGHATIQETFDRYGHLMPGGRDEARLRVDAYFEGRPDRAPNARQTTPALSGS